jgi:hypothetical protein
VQIEYAVNDLNDLEELVGVLCKFWSLTRYTLARTRAKLVFWFYQRRSFGGKYGGKIIIKSNLYNDISISG